MSLVETRSAQPDLVIQANRNAKPYQTKLHQNRPIKDKPNKPSPSFQRWTHVFCFPLLLSFFFFLYITDMQKTNKAQTPVCVLFVQSNWRQTTTKHTEQAQEYTERTIITDRRQTTKGDTISTNNLLNEYIKKCILNKLNQSKNNPNKLTTN